MSVLDRVVRDTRARLEPFEGLLGCVLGREEGGRRRVAVIATDRRIVLAAPRRTAPRWIAYEDLTDVTLGSDAAGAVLRLVTAEAVHGIDRIAEERAARLLHELLTARRDRQELPERPPAVRVIA